MDRGGLQARVAQRAAGRGPVRGRERQGARVPRGRRAHADAGGGAADPGARIQATRPRAAATSNATGRARARARARASARHRMVSRGRGARGASAGAHPAGAAHRVSAGRVQIRRGAAKSATRGARGRMGRGVVTADSAGGQRKGAEETTGGPAEMKSGEVPTTARRAHTARTGSRGSRPAPPCLQTGSRMNQPGTSSRTPRMMRCPRSRSSRPRRRSRPRT